MQDVGVEDLVPKCGTVFDQVAEAFGVGAVDLAGFQASGEGFGGRVGGVAGECGGEGGVCFVVQGGDLGWCEHLFDDYAAVFPEGLVDVLGG